jgi:sugar (pentulose or hexulose) kinase
MRILALDIGSTSVKAGLWNGNTFSAKTRVPFRTRLEGAIAEIHANGVLAAILRAGSELLNGNGPIDAVSYCIFSSGVIVTDLHNKPLTPIITHADRRSSATSLALVQKRSKSWWLSRTGNLPYPGGIGSSTLAWLRDNHPGAFRKPYRVGQVSSFVGSFLTGGLWLTDPSQAVFLGLWDIRRNHWNTDACKVVGVSPEALPECRWADDVLGGLSATVARRWNVRAGIPVIGGFVDTSAAIIQTPMHNGQLVHNTGSTDVLALCVDRRYPAEGILTRPIGVSGKWSKHSGKPPWLAIRTMASAGSAMDWARRTLFPRLTDNQWRSLVMRSCKTLSQSGNTSVQCVPTFVGERAALAQPTGASFSGIRLSTDSRQLLESVIQALVAQSAKNYSLLANIYEPQRTVYSMGGASAVGDAMHASWPGKHTFRHLTADGLFGLVLLVERTLGAPARRP